MAPYGRKEKIMKKIFGMIIASLMFSNVGFSEIRKIEEKRIDVLGSYTVAATVCIDGYKFAIYKSGSGSNMVQFYEWNGLKLEEKG